MARKTPETPETFADKFTEKVAALMVIADVPAAIIWLVDEIINGQLTAIGETALSIGITITVIGAVSILMARHGVFGPKE